MLVLAGYDSAHKYQFVTNLLSSLLGDRMKSGIYKVVGC